MALKRDQIDLLCESWARVRREVLGFRHPASARDFIGAPRCTLAPRRDLHATNVRPNGASQAWPEVYTGDLLIVNRAIKAMTPEMRMLVDVHWTLERPRDKGARAELIGMTRGQYWRRVGRAKEFIAGALAVNGTGCQ